MKKYTLTLLIVISMFILGTGWYTFSTHRPATVQTLPATINRDCAPWDGAAFTISIPLEIGTAINISIWQSPDIKFSKTFSFPDNTGEIGNAVHRSALDEYEQLSGKVFFSRVNMESPVEGEFDLKDEKGNQFKGKFKAEWSDQVVMCG
jgi:hypothetical protein